MRGASLDLVATPEKFVVVASVIAPYIVQGAGFRKSAPWRSFSNGAV